MKTKFEKIDDNISFVTVTPSKKDLAYFNGKVWEYKGKTYNKFEDIPL